MPDYFLRQGDDTASLATTLLDANGDPVDISGAAVYVEIAPVEGGTYLYGGGPTLEEANNDQLSQITDVGAVSFDFPDPVDDPGFYYVNWIVIFQTQAVQTFPNDGSELLYVSADTSETAYDAFATSADLQDRLGVQFTAEEHRRATRLLELATGMIRQAFGGQTMSLVEDDTYTFHANFESSIRLAQRPVTEITSVSVNGELMDPDSYYLNGDYLVRASSSYWPLQSTFGGPMDEITVVYSHGYEELPGDLVTVCLDVVARVWTNPASVGSETVGSLTMAFPQGYPIGMTLTEEEKKKIGAVLGNGLATIPLR